ncbi:MAG TPA: HEAT repeat domain-containing protein [Kofleriaceae bacterium]|nr:HEAT repeat domain-containing protein [Kofleriaceae bacterium]
MRLAPLGLSLGLNLLLALGCAQHNKQSVTLYEAGDYAGAARAAEAGLATHPKDSGLWQMRIRAALALGDAPGVARAYESYRAHYGGDDETLLRDLAIATLGQALASPSAKLKLTAIEAVASAELHALADQVAERMGDENDQVAASAAIAILRGYPQAPQVADDMLRSEDPEARRIALDGIARKIGAIAIAEIRKAAEDPEPRVRRAALRWLGQLKDRPSQELLERALRHADEGVRAAAATALARLGAGDLAAFAKQALADRALAVRLAGVELLRAAKQTAELTALAEDPEPLVALEAAIATNEPALRARALERAAASDKWTTRAAAANTAARAVDRTAAAALAKRLAGDPELAVRLAAARTLASTGDRAAAIEIFAAALGTDAALSAAADLARFGDARGEQALDAAIRSTASGADQRAAAVAAHVTARRVTPGLVAALADGSGVVRVEAAAALVAIAR